MKIALVSRGRDLFWYVSNCRLPEETVIKQYESLDGVFKYVNEVIPDIILIEGFDQVKTIDFIKKIKNHVFARNAIFIISTHDRSVNTRRSYIVAGAALLLYRNTNKFPPPQEFGKMIRWACDFKNFDTKFFDTKSAIFNSKAIFSTHGRMGWLSKKHCLIECDLELSVGEKIRLSHLTFEDLGLKLVKIQVLEKNSIGRYYHYANSYLCEIITDEYPQLPKVINNWVKNNQKSDWNKPVKILYYESDIAYRDEIRLMLKENALCCPRGYSNMDDVLDNLNYQLPQLVLINRSFITQSSEKFNSIKRFQKSSSTIVITYSLTESPTQEIDSLKKNYPFALHSNGKITLPLLEAMIKKIQEKLKANDKPDYNPRIVFRKTSMYSNIKLVSEALIAEISEVGMTVKLPHTMSLYCAGEISSKDFATIKINPVQFVRAITPARKDEKGHSTHKTLFIAQDEKEYQLLLKATGKAEEESPTS